MDDPERFRALIDAAERPENDEAFERLARGELSAAEVEALRSSPDPEKRQLFELFQPLGPASRSRFDCAVEQTFARQGNPAAGSGDGEPQAARLPWRRVRPLAYVGVPLAMAAAIALFFTTSLPPPEPLEVRSLERVVPRSDSGSSLLGASDTESPTAKKKPEQLTAGKCWHLQLRVRSSGRLPSSVSTYFANDSAAVAWPVTWKPHNNNQLAPVDGCARLPELAPGTWDLIVISDQRAVQRTPQAASELCRRPAPAGAKWRCDRKTIQVVPLPPSLL